MANLDTTTDASTAIVGKAVLKSIRCTPQKARRVVNIIRGERADSALSTLKFAPQEIGADLFTLLNSAVNNAKQKNPSLRDASELWIIEALVDEGFTMKRYRPRAQGRGFAINKRSSQVTVVLSDDKNLRTNKNLKASQMQKPKALRTPSVIKDAPAATKAADALSDKPVAKKAAAKKATAKKAPAKKAATKGKAE